MIPVSWAIGDTFGILQGSVDFTDEFQVEVYLDENNLFQTQSIVPQENLYATSITIPATYSRVTVVPIVQNIRLDSVILHSGETLRADIQTNIVENEEQLISTSSSSSSSFTFQPLENEQMINDISQGEYEAYENEIEIMPIPSIIDSSSQTIPTKESSTQNTLETPAPIKKSLLEKMNAFFLEPVVLLSIMLIACLLIMTLVLKGKRTKYL